jgi:hypothetical protein
MERTHRCYRRNCMHRVALVPFAISILWGQDPAEIVRKSVERDAYNAERLKNYTFVERVEERMYDKNGRRKSTEVETSEVLILSGRPYGRKIAKDDKPLSEKEARKEQEKLDKEAERRLKESASDKAKLEKDRAEGRRFLREVPEAFTFRLLGVEQVSAKPVWVIDAAPKAGYKPRDKRAALLTRLHGKLWIDQNEYQWVKAEAEVLDTMSFGWGLFRIAPGGSFRFEQMRMNDEVWVPLSISARADARLAFVKRMHGEVDVAYRDYKKFQADSRIVSLENEAVDPNR